jgi:hypothetical protein
MTTPNDSLRVGSIICLDGVVLACAQHPESSIYEAGKGVLEFGHVVRLDDGDAFRDVWKVPVGRAQALEVSEPAVRRGDAAGPGRVIRIPELEGPGVVDLADERDAADGEHGHPEGTPLCGAFFRGKTHPIAHEQTALWSVEVVESNREVGAFQLRSLESALPIQAVEGVSGIGQEYNLNVISIPEGLESVRRSFTSPWQSTCKLCRSTRLLKVLFGDSEEGFAQESPDDLTDADGPKATVLLAESKESSGQ